MNEIVSDLRAEQDALDEIVSAIETAAWSTPTPAEGWDVQDQVGHLCFFDERATEAVLDPDAFTAQVMRVAADAGSYMASHLASTRALSPGDLLSRWRSARGELLTALGALDASTRLPWYGPSMSARSFATARLMETWAHTQDVTDALGCSREPTDRLRHIAFLGVKTMGWSFTVNGLDLPAETVRVDLTGPSGDRWVWNKEVESNIVSGDVEDFCLVVTQRRNVADTSLDVTGDVAREWMTFAQAFAGPPGGGRPAGLFS